MNKELKDVLPYYLHKVKVKIVLDGQSELPWDEDNIQDLEGLMLDYYPIEVKEIKPILYPLSMLTKPITHEGETFKPSHSLWDSYWDETNYTIPNGRYGTFNFEDIAALIEWRFDVFGLIEQGKAIDVTTLKENPYENN